MSLAMILFSMITAWMAVAISMLWGVQRIARRYYPLVQTSMSPPTRWKYLPAPKHHFA